MRGTAVGRRGRPKESFAQDRKPPPIATPTAADPWQFTTAAGRDSDASFCSSRPSTSSITRSAAAASLPTSDRSYQLAALRSINAYLSSHSSSTSLKPPLPSAKDITETIRFVISRLDFTPSNKLDEDLQIVLKHLNCPIKLNKSALRAPGTPHSWPNLLAVINWLVQIAVYKDHLANSTQTWSNYRSNDISMYALNTYLPFIQGDDGAVDEFDREFTDKMQKEREGLEEGLKELGESAGELEARVKGLKTELSPKEALEREKGMLEEDVTKFHAMIEQLNGHIAAVEKVLEEKERELELKVGERGRIGEENEELKRRVEEQAINSRDAERMKRELQAVERDIGESEAARSGWEEKSWDLDAAIGQKFKELEAHLIECNQAIKRLKLGNGFQYELNAKGSTPAEILGIDYKTTIKPALASLAENLKESSMAKLEELISLQQLSVENAAKIEAKRNRIAVLQSHIDEAEVALNLLKKDIQDHTSRCSIEARKLVEDVEAEAHNLSVIEREAEEFMKTAKVKLQEANVQIEEEVQKCARELFALVDSVSKYVEYMPSKVSEMNSHLLETAGAISDFHRRNLPS
ncbi:hypothetical protein RJ639_022290 [Escallonia herrerae]|uniref:Kinetochore protein NDC80 n=1 Tax=Escallonia herrerae TaxID=1293975 RepID=A0AA88V4Z0_9ASTE|nr:hypothetical protein RJ639_022290 [Escallonia herrerae]